MASGYKNPPLFKEGMDYDQWKNELKIWQLVTELDKEKMALAVTLTLTGKAREAALGITAADLNKAAGMKTLTDKLDGIFEKEKKDHTYEVYRTFESLTRDENVSMSDYCVEFDQKYQKCKDKQMVLPDAVLAFKLLDKANLTTQGRQLALTACQELTYDAMKSALKRIFSDSSAVTETQNGASVAIKQETAFYTGQNQRRKPAFTVASKSNSKTLKGTNPLNRFGQPSRCKICQSTFHWWKNCPNKAENINVTESDVADNTSGTEECNVVLFTEAALTENEIFVVESHCAAVIDTACTKTVCGEKWLHQYMDATGIQDMRQYSSDRQFKFGDGKIVHSHRKVVLPALIGQTKCNIEAEVVNVDIPLLLSKASLKKAGTVLDLENDKAVMFKEPVQLHFTSSGHYCVSIINRELHVDDSVHVLVTDGIENTVDKKKMLTKLHKQFAHATADRLIQLLKCAGNEDKNVKSMLDEVIQECDTCKVHKKPNPRPIVGFPLASEYNETVAVDLHQLENNVWYLHIIDEFTRFSAGCVVRSKHASVFVKCFLRHWISIHGPPRRLFSDNGGEFDNDEVRDMAENFSIEIVTTPAYSPWSNGLLERHNQTLTDMLLRVKHDNPHLDWETALCWALMAKNSLQNTHGFSACQLVFGKNPNLPSVLTAKPPALEGTTSSQVVGNHIVGLHAARQAFTKAECSERIRRALRKQTRPTPDICRPGDKVFYKRPDSQKWRGPGVVIGEDGPVVFVRHGGSLVRVHKCRLRKDGHPVSHSQSESTGTGESDTHDTVNNETDDDTVIPPNASQQHGEVSETESDHEREEHDCENDHDATGRQENEVCEQLPVIRQNFTALKLGDRISYTHSETGENIQAKITSRAGKATGKNSTWYNVKCLMPENLEGTELSVDVSKVENLQVNEHTGTDEQILVVDDLRMDEAKIKELESWKQNGVYTEVEDEGQKTISTRWVCSLKSTPNGLAPKARLVARGFEEYSADLQTDSPTCAHESLRVVLSVMACRQWEVHSMDIKTAFLQGVNIERDVFIKPPREAGREGKVWHLNKCVYGLNDASLHWYLRVKDVMTKCGAHISEVDPAVFIWSRENGDTMGVLACHVDDFIWAGDELFTGVIEKVRSMFNVGKEASVAFQYCGIELSCDMESSKILLNQDKYTDDLTPVNIDPSRALSRDSELTETEKHDLRSKLGQLLWLAHQTRPDILFDVCHVAVNIKSCTVNDLLQINKIILKAKSSKLSLTFQCLSLHEGLSLLIFSDAAFGNLPDGGSQGGYVIFLSTKSGRLSPIWWNSKKIRRVVRSTLAAETLAMSEAVDMGIFIATLFGELIKGKPDPCILPIVCVVDCKSLVDALKSSKYVSEKRLRIELSSLKQLVENGQIKQIQWCDSKSQLADCLTKHGASPYYLRSVLYQGYLNL